MREIHQTFRYLLRKFCWTQEFYIFSKKIGELSENISRKLEKISPSNWFPSEKNMTSWSQKQPEEKNSKISDSWLKKKPRSLRLGFLTNITNSSTFFLFYLEKIHFWKILKVNVIEGPLYTLIMIFFIKKWVVLFTNQNYRFF